MKRSIQLDGFGDDAHQHHGAEEDPLPGHPSALVADAEVEHHDPDEHDARRPDGHVERQLRGLAVEAELPQAVDPGLRQVHAALEREEQAEGDVESGDDDSQHGLPVTPEQT